MAKVLLVEANSVVRSALRKILEESGHDVLEASDGSQGAEICRTQNAEIVVTDIVLPNAGGIAMLNEFKRDFPAIPMIAMSGGNKMRNLDCRALAKEFGAHRVLTKPFFPNDLIAAINGAMSGVPAYA